MVRINLGRHQKTWTGNWAKNVSLFPWKAGRTRVTHLVRTDRSSTLVTSRARPPSPQNPNYWSKSTYTVKLEHRRKKHSEKKRRMHGVRRRRKCHIVRYPPPPQKKKKNKPKKTKKTKPKTNTKKTTTTTKHTHTHKHPKGKYKSLGTSLSYLQWICEHLSHRTTRTHTHTHTHTHTPRQSHIRSFALAVCKLHAHHQARKQRPAKRENKQVHRAACIQQW